MKGTVTPTGFKTRDMYLAAFLAAQENITGQRSFQDPTPEPDPQDPARIWLVFTGRPDSLESLARHYADGFVLVNASRFVAAIHRMRVLVYGSKKDGTWRPAPAHIAQAQQDGTFRRGQD